MGHGKVYPTNGGTPCKAGVHNCEVESYIYKHATHFVFPEGLVKAILPVVGDLMPRVFAAGRNYPKECKAARVDIERHVTDAIRSWGRANG